MTHKKYGEPSTIEQNETCCPRTTSSEAQQILQAKR